MSIDNRCVTINDFLMNMYIKIKCSEISVYTIKNEEAHRVHCKENSDEVNLLINIHEISAS